ncbi:MAG: cytochrome c oxidase assembly protein [Proteobacteria bacterium]|nr:cytochrome c oxidase assembly protein [Pseudomonadota bacterium]
MTWEWNTEIDLIGGILAVAVLYRMAVRMGWKRLAAETPFPTRSVLLFDVALVLFYLAVGSPLDEAGDRFLFSAHMLQHSVLIFVLPPIILASLPSFVFEPLAGNRATRAVFAFLTHPVVALASFNIVFAVWHIPVLYEFALRDRQVHEAEHVMFLLSAIQMWWPVLSPSRDFPRLTAGPRMLYLFFMSVTQIPLFGFLVLTGEVYYPTYAAAPRIVSLTPMEDQALGGIFMKLFGEILFICYLAAAFMEWYRRESRPGAPPKAA